MTSNLSALSAGVVLAYSPCFLYATVVHLCYVTEIRVYRSVKVKDRHKLYEQVLKAVGGIKPIVLEVVDDEDMAFGKAESLLYVIPKKKVELCPVSTSS